MKKFVSIVLLSLFAFNLVGYRVILWCESVRQDAAMAQVVDNSQYDENDLITIRVPLSMPYQVNSTSFERVDGEATVKGKVYRYVKRRIDNGVLVLMCLPDHQKSRLHEAGNEFFKTTADINTDNGSKKQSNTVKYNASEYEELASHSGSMSFALLRTPGPLPGAFMLADCVLDAPAPPPKAC